MPFPGEDHCYCKVAESGNHDQCRTHAEQRAITLAREGDGWWRLQGSKLIYLRLETDDSVRLEMPHLAEWMFALPDTLIGYSSVDYDAIAQLRW